jgi:hypothetical protein
VQDDLGLKDYQAMLDRELAGKRRSTVIAGCRRIWVGNETPRTRIDVLALAVVSALEISWHRPGMDQNASPVLNWR